MSYYAYLAQPLEHLTLITNYKPALFERQLLGKKLHGIQFKAAQQGGDLFACAFYNGWYCPV
jgi:hypothetical protein